jgi:hypothetical protein
MPVVRSLDLAEDEPGGDHPQDTTVMKVLQESHFRLSLVFRRVAAVRFGFRTTESMQKGLTFLLLTMSAALPAAGAIAIGAATHAPYWQVMCGFVLMVGGVLAAGILFTRRRR